MQDSTITHILQMVAEGALTPEQALEKCRLAPLEDMLTGLTLDNQRELRTGLGEVVFAQNKSDAQLCCAMEKLSDAGPVMATHVSATQGTMLQKYFPQGQLWEEAHIFCLNAQLPMTSLWPTEGEVLVLSAGAADRPVALEAFASLHFWGINAGFIADVGVAGLHRLAPHLPALTKTRIIIAVAGMEGALPGVVAGFVRCPVLAVPTSVGYGVGTGGYAALSTMLCTCVPGVAVLNIDNGFGAASFAAKFIKRERTA